MYEIFLSWSKKSMTPLLYFVRYCHGDVPNALFYSSGKRDVPQAWTSQNQDLSIHRSRQTKCFCGNFFSHKCITFAPNILFIILVKKPNHTDVTLCMLLPWWLPKDTIYYYVIYLLALAKKGPAPAPGQQTPFIAACSYIFNSFHKKFQRNKHTLVLILLYASESKNLSGTWTLHAFLSGANRLKSHH